MQYSHRNGESEPPTMAGHYWFKGRRSRWKIQHLLWVVMVDKHSYGVVVSSDMCIPVSEYEGQWWGPIQPPWEQSP